MAQIYDGPDPDAATARGADTPGGRHPGWKLLPWILLAVMLAVLPYLRGRFMPARPAPVPSSAPAASLPASVPSVTTGPLTVTLYSAASGRHIRLGTPITISAFAGVPAGQSATLALSYARKNGAKSVLTLVQGSFCSTTYTPAAAGLYEFTASALDSRKNAVFARPLPVWVDTPKVNTPKAVAAPSAARPPVKVVYVPAPPLPRPARRPPARRAPTPQKTSRPVPRPAPPIRVAAARFTYRPVAETLAGALRRRGYHAFVRVGRDPRGKAIYSVETGDYALPVAAAQAAKLKHDGYPAFMYRTR